MGSWIGWVSPISTKPDGQRNPLFDPEPTNPRGDAKIVLNAPSPVGRLPVRRPCGVSTRMARLHAVVASGRFDILLALKRRGFPGYGTWPDSPRSLPFLLQCGVTR